MDFLSRQRAQRAGTEPPQRSFSGLPPAQRSLRDDNRDASNTPPRAMGTWKTSGPAASARPAAQSVMAGRKLFNRNQNPARAGAGTTRSFSDAPMNTPGRVFASGSFKSGLLNGNGPKFTFSPRVPHNTIRESFPAVTPGRSFRGASADMSGRAMSKTNTATNLFQMRISSPPRELDGEALTKQIPENPSRVGSIYADEFLSHLVPAELDELQRRQFFCILDLRRLKYASNEIFVKKDWRVNIMNFAKEYEKSRSLIMLRYGLYEFKTVPASRELLKKWKADNNVDDSDENMADRSSPVSQGSVRASSKRRAEDDLTKDTVSRDSFTPYKRRAPDRDPLAESTAPTSNAGVTPFPKKTKRRLEDADDEENHPSKIQKPTKPSATFSVFEQVANNTPAKTAASPPKPAPKPVSKPLFGSAADSKLFASGQSSSVKPATSGGNIFGHLSQDNSQDNSPSGSDDDDDDADGDSEVEEVPVPETKAPSAAPMFGTPGASLFGSKPSTSTPFGGSNTTSSMFGQGPSLMERVTSGETDKPAAKRPTSPLKQPQDQTYNPNTPLKFGATPGGLFGQPSTTPAFGTQVKDFATETPKPVSMFNQAEKPSLGGSNLFGSSNKPALFGTSEQQKPETTAPSSLFAPKPQDATTTTPFGKPAETPSTEASKPMFGAMTTPTPNPSNQTSSLFGAKIDKPASSLFNTADKSSAPLFGAPNGDTPATTPSLFGTKSATEEKKEESAAKRKKPDSDAPVDQPAPKFSFGGPAPTPAAKLPPKTEAAAKGATDAASVFGAPVTGEKKYIFGAPAAPPAATPAATPAAAPAAAPAPTFAFGNNTAPQAEPAKASAPASTISFGNNTNTTFSTEPAKAPASTSMFNFGSNAASQAPAPTPASGGLFGNATEPTKPQPSLFSNAAPSASSSGFSFGTQATTTNPPSSGLFGAGATNNGTTSNTATQGGLFGSGTSTPAEPVVFNAAQPPSFDFGATSTGFQFGSTPAGGPPQFSFGGASAAPAPAPAPAAFSFGGGAQPAAPTNGMFGGAAPTEQSSMFNFGVGSGPQEQSQPSQGMFGGQPANAAQGIFASGLAAPPTSASGANTPLFGGASSIATTPATGTPEPDAAKNDSANNKADDEDAPQDQQLSLAEGGPGEEGEEVVYEVKTKAFRHVLPQPDDDDDVKAKKKKNPWNIEGVGPLRVLKHQTTGAVRVLLRAVPSGKVAMNKLVLPNFDYKVDDKAPKTVKVTTAKDDGKGLETWLLQVKTHESAVKLATALEENKMANKS